jgi:hypothetical protein
VNVARERTEFLDTGFLYPADMTSLFEAEDALEQFFRERPAIELTDILLSSDTDD